MQLKKIKLNNIRSYEDEEIKFTEGITLLSGNIGSGKSTILLSIDFALFGVRRGELDGASLLRNGADSGYVILDLIINNKSVSIKRILKKSTSGIAQTAGYLTINDITKELTPVELKQRILELLNYPQEMLTKKSMIYRYTVYTPQEEAKAILLGEKELRLETLRKVFNIDKYKRIKDNYKVLISELKLKKKESAALIYDLEDKKTKLNENEILQKSLSENIAVTNYYINKKLESIAGVNINITKIEEQIKALNNFRKESEIVSLNIKLKQENHLKSQLILEKNLLEIENMSKELNLDIDIVKIRTQIEENNKYIMQSEQELKEILRKISELRTKKIHSHEIKDKITKLDNCPLCEQTVLLEHKNNITNREDQKLSEIANDIKNFETKEKELEQLIFAAKNIIENLKIHESSYKVIELKKLNLNSKKEATENLSKELFLIKEEINVLNNKKIEITSKLNALINIEPDYLKEKAVLDSLMNELKQMEIDRAKKEQELKNINLVNIDLIKEIQFKEDIKSKLEYYIKLSEWMESFFLNVINIMERKVMLKIHNDFNTLFQKWFFMIMNSESIKVRLDEEFTPIIEQNGYDMEYENLSGGEKSACALSYRLALNQIINNLISHINTKDLIILDEPTDGLSSEQLERIRLVLQELNMKQIIIVSHESKIETFVDNIIKVEKDNHISKIIC